MKKKETKNTRELSWENLVLADRLGEGRVAPGLEGSFGRVKRILLLTVGS